MTHQCGEPMVQVLVVRVNIGMVTYEAMTPLCWRSVIQFLVVRVDIGVVTYEAITPVWEVSGERYDCQGGWRLGDLVQDQTFCLKNCKTFTRRIHVFHHTGLSLL